MFADDAKLTASSGWREARCGLGDLPSLLQGEWDLSTHSHYELAFKSVERLCLPGMGWDGRFLSLVPSAMHLLIIPSCIFFFLHSLPTVFIPVSVFFFYFSCKACALHALVCILWIRNSVIFKSRDCKNVCRALVRFCTDILDDKEFHGGK